MRTTFRSLIQRPVFSLTVIVTLALSLGLAGAILSLLNEVFVRPLPYPRAPSTPSPPTRPSAR